VHPLRRNVSFQTERLTIRPPFKNDYAAWHGLRDESRHYLAPWEPTWAIDALSTDDWQRHIRGWKEAWKADRAYAFFIWKGTDLVGGMTFSNVRRGPAQMTSLGYWQGEQHQGNGFMREAVFAGCVWVFKVLCLQRIEAGTLTANERSQSLLRSIGFQEEGLARSYLQINGKRHDHVMFGLVRDANTF